ncbi:MAG: PepSY domain-containing protein [Ferrovibrio sp.]|uniref:PepSY-associated TM helix domain-containing protein n=1 Tax=Ferrovibrio sp. TaxID=1917215 RepID=UPI002612BC9C|nr:PepSY-associated TM helix domain-containing protein [Ferrovibrio sp.]MCW0233065.1 PepSY domain-containing protein [Ferrovibrio sp.]
MAARLKALVDRRAMRRLHGLLGFWLCLVLGWLCLFGTLTTIGHELDWLVRPALRVGVPDGVVPGTYVSWGRMEATIRDRYPDWTLQRITLPQGSRFAAEARMIAAQGQPRLVYIDPYRAIVTGDGGRDTIQSTLRQLHRQFHLPNVGDVNVGIYLSTPFALILLFMLVSGLVIYPQFWRGLFRLRLRHGIGPLLNDLHRLVAGWSLWFLLAISLTGMWYFAERLLYDLGTSLEPPAPKATLSAAAALPLDELTALTQAAFPELRIAAVYFPRRNGDALRFDGQAGNLMVRDRANKVYLDPKTGAVLGVERIAGQGFWPRWRATVNPLHFGDFAGIWSRLVWFLFGGGLTALVFSGAWMYWRALRQQRDLARRRRARRHASA